MNGIRRVELCGRNLFRLSNTVANSLDILYICIWIFLQYLSSMQLYIFQFVYVTAVHEV